MAKDKKTHSETYLRPLTYPAISGGATPPSSPGQHSLNQHKILYELFTRIFEELRPTATMYMAPAMYVSLNPEAQETMAQQPLVTTNGAKPRKNPQ